MADSAYGLREIVIDLALTGARTIKDAAAFVPEIAIIEAIKINGTTGAGAGDIILRKRSASGPIVFKELCPSGTSFDGSLTPVHIRAKGLYMDALGTAWGAGSTLILYLC